MNQKHLNILAAIFGWRLCLFVIAFLGGWWLRYDPSFPYATTLLNSFNLPQWLYSWGNFDGVHYLTIVDRGYKGVGLIQAFFPLYPLLVSFVDLVIHNALLSALFVSHLSLLALIYFFIKLTKSEYNSQVAKVSLIVLLTFPTSFFFGAVYGESLFLLLILSSFLAARQQKWWAAGMLGALASATRIVGVAILPALFLELWLQNRKSSLSLTHFVVSNKTKIIAIGISALGLLGYMTYLWLEFQNPFMFLNVQSEFGGGRSESIILYPQVVWRYIKILMTVTPNSWQYLSYIQEFAVGTLGLLGLLLSFKHVRKSYWLFAVLAFIIPTLSGTFSSLSRYVLVCFPLFWWLALKFTKSKKRYLFLYLAISSLLLIMNVVLFIQGYWVA